MCAHESLAAIAAFSGSGERSAQQRRRRVGSTRSVSTLARCFAPASRRTSAFWRRRPTIRRSRYPWFLCLVSLCLCLCPFARREHCCVTTQKHPDLQLLRPSFGTSLRFARTMRLCARTRGVPRRSVRVTQRRVLLLMKAAGGLKTATGSRRTLQSKLRWRESCSALAGRTE